MYLVLGRFFQGFGLSKKISIRIRKKTRILNTVANHRYLTLGSSFSLECLRSIIFCSGISSTAQDAYNSSFLNQHHHARDNFLGDIWVNPATERCRKKQKLNRCLSVGEDSARRAKIRIEKYRTFCCHFIITQYLTRDLLEICLTFFLVYFLPPG